MNYEEADIIGDAFCQKVIDRLLRDFIAAQTAPALIMYHDKGLAQEDELPLEKIAEQSYQFADLMLQQRAKW